MQANGQRPPASSPTAPSQTQAMQVSDLNKIVLEYLSKKGYSRTEAMLRLESSRTPTPADSEAGPSSQSGTAPFLSASSIEPAGYTPIDVDPAAFVNAYAKLKDWIQTSLEMYQPELRRIMYPIFVHVFLELVLKQKPDLARQFFDQYSADYELLHGQDLEQISAVSLPQHVQDNELARAFRNHKYQIQISRSTFDLLLYFLHEVEATGGSIVLRVLNQYVDARVGLGRSGGSGALAVQPDGEDALDPNEGIPERLSLPTRNLDQFNSQPVKLGPLPPDEEFHKDVTLALQEKDAKLKLVPSLAEQYEAQVRREDSENHPEYDLEQPSRDALPLPPYKSVDVEDEVRRVVEARSRVHLSASQASMPSVCMYTFHNTNDSMNALEFSDDSTLVAAGFSDSFVKLWSLKGEKLTSVLKGDEPSTTRRLVGHSKAVYGLSFSRDNRYLLSSSGDKTVRLWSLDTYKALVAYKGHSQPVWDVEFGPQGHYFATGSHDHTARLWSCDHIYPLRIFAGHLSDVDTVKFHPNGTYVFTGSSDKTVRMWDVNRGSSVRVFIGHTAPVHTLAVSDDGRWLASAGEDSLIHLWDIGMGRRLKTFRGHGRSSIYSLAFSREGNLLVSGAGDNTVRVWDVKRGTSEPGPEPEHYAPAEEAAAAADKKSTGAAADTDSRKKREVVASADHMAVFNTKRTPVYKVQFTHRNLCLAGGAFSE